MIIKKLSYEEAISTGCTHAVTVAYTDTTNTTLVSLPAGSVVGRVIVRVDTAFNTGTSHTLSVGTTASATAYINAVDIKGGANHFLYNTGAIITAASQYLVVTLTGSGTAATAGALTIGVNLGNDSILPS